MSIVASSSKSNEPGEIKFNGKTYTSWRDARNAYRIVSAKGGTKSVWAMVSLHAEDVNDDNSPFVLKCKTCSKTCQLRNPAKWKADHKCKGPISKLQRQQPIGMGAGLPGLGALPPRNV